MTWIFQAATTRPLLPKTGRPHRSCQSWNSNIIVDDLFDDERKRTNNEIASNKRRIMHQRHVRFSSRQDTDDDDDDNSMVHVALYPTLSRTDYTSEEKNNCFWTREEMSMFEMCRCQSAHHLMCMDDIVSLVDTTFTICDQLAKSIRIESRIGVAGRTAHRDDSQSSSDDSHCRETTGILSKVLQNPKFYCAALKSIAHHPEGLNVRGLEAAITSLPRHQHRSRRSSVTEMVSSKVMMNIHSFTKAMFPTSSNDHTKYRNAVSRTKNYRQKTRQLVLSMSRQRTGRTDWPKRTMNRLPANANDEEIAMAYHESSIEAIIYARIQGYADEQYAMLVQSKEKSTLVGM
jgi:hypothetical protein